MSIEQITSGLQTALNAANANFSLTGGNDFANGLQLGQVLKGKVLRHFEGNRYLVSFNGQEKVVDSSVPFRTDEVIYGRVIGLGERVELQRVHAEKTDIAADKNNAAARQPANDAPLGKHAQLIQQLFERFAGKISAQDSDTLLRLVKTAAEPKAMVTAGLVLSKIGIGQSPELLKAVYDVLAARSARQGLFALPDQAPQLATTASISNDNNKSVTDLLAPLIASLINQMPHKSRAQDFSTPSALVPSDVPDQKKSISPDTPQQDLTRRQNQQDQPRIDLSHWLLNAQTDGAVSHRVGTLPFWLGDQLVEVDVAMFDQRPGANSKDGVKHRQVVISLNLEQLGRVELAAKVAGERVRVRITAEDADKTEMISHYMANLRGAIRAAGWEIDEMAYSTWQDFPRGAVSQSVIEHIVSQDSLNRLM